MLITLLLKKKKRKNKERKRKERRGNAHCDTVKNIIFLLYTSYNCLLYCCTTVYMCSCLFCSLSLLHSYLYLLLQSIFAHENNIILCTLLCVLCTRLVCTLWCLPDFREFTYYQTYKEGSP